MTNEKKQPQTFTCRVCQAEKPVEDFRGDSRMPYGIDYECKECRRARMATNGEYLQGRLRKYKKRKGDAVMLITAEQLESLLTNHSCAYCGDPLTNDNSTVDHIFSLSQDYGGANIVGNIVQACRSCNSSKQDFHIADFYHRSEKFTSKLWTAFVKSYTERLIGRPINDLEVEIMKANLEAEAEELRRNIERKEVAANG